jgi:uncharacterized tellurite resistance protein B-like protein
MISVTTIPGGSPIAKAEPEVWATEWTRCFRCSSYTCDRCLQKQIGNCKCGFAMPLLGEVERIQIARDMVEGKAAPGPQALAVARVAPPPPAPAPGAGQVSVPLRRILDGIGSDLEADLARGNAERVRTQARLAGTMMSMRMGSVAPDDFAWLMRFGENFYRWQCFEDGLRYWQGLLDTLDAMGMGNSKEAIITHITAQAFSALAGKLTAANPNASKIAMNISKLLGPQHPLARDAVAKLGGAPAAAASLPPNAPSAAPPAPPAGPEVPRVRITLPAPQLSPALAAFDTTTKLALWVTLAFLDVALADGRVADNEYMSWKNVMVRMNLPDVWQRFGLPGLQQMLHHGALYELCAHFASLPVEQRVQMTTVLVEFMFADGRADMTEIASVRKIAAWLGVQVDLGQQ